MKTRSLLLFCATLTLQGVPSYAANRTWNGEADSVFWNDGNNWVGGNMPTVTGDVLIFAGSRQLSTLNTHVTAVNGLTFAQGAGSFVLDGQGFTLNGNILNESGVTQTIYNDLTFNFNRTIDTGSGTIVLAGNIDESDGARELIKNGSGTLTIAGGFNLTGPITLNTGRILVDTDAGGYLAGGNVMLGQQAFVTNTNGGGILEIRGSSSGTTLIERGQLYMGRSTGGNQIIVDSNGGEGTTLQFATWGYNSDPARNGNPTLNIKLVGANSAFKAPIDISNDINVFVTVTDSVKTGFATVDSDGFVVRNTTTTALPTSSAFHNSSTSGLTTLTGNVTGNSITITGGGTLDGATRNVQTRAVLMEEGAGDYTMNVQALGWGGVYIHQYSTSGTLTLNGNFLGSAGGNYSSNTFVKTGSGTFIFNGAGTLVAGATDIHQGRFQLNGTLKDTSLVQVRSGGILGGSGEIGGGDTWIWSSGNVNTEQTRYTPVSVYTGGTLDASDGLQITGSLTLYNGATFHVSLSPTQQALTVVGNPDVDTPIVTLAGDLQLELLYGIPFYETIVLLTTDGLITGEFATVNGQTIGEDHMISLVFNSKTYDMALVYTDNSVILSAIPEPTTVSLLVGAGMLGFFVWRRRSR
jgi:autotransporter-associated beta strand protein